MINTHGTFNETRTTTTGRKTDNNGEIRGWGVTINENIRLLVLGVALHAG